MAAHPHAENMKLFAEDAMKTDKPWELWEVKASKDMWTQCSDYPVWIVGLQYRRKPEKKPDVVYYINALPRWLSVTQHSTLESALKAAKDYCESRNANYLTVLDLIFDGDTDALKGVKIAANYHASKGSPRLSRLSY